MWDKSGKNLAAIGAGSLPTRSMVATKGGGVGSFLMTKTDNNMFRNVRGVCLKI